MGFIWRLHSADTRNRYGGDYVLLGSAKKRPLAHSKKAPEGANVVRKLGFMNIATNETRFRAVYLMRHHLPVFLISHYQDDATLG